MNASATLAEPLADKRGPPRSTLFNWTSSTLIALLALAAVLLHLGLRYLSAAYGFASRVPLFVALIAGGLPLVVQLTRKLINREFGSDLLAGVSILTSVLLGEYLVGVI